MGFDKAANRVPVRRVLPEKETARQELVRHLIARRVPEKEDILQAKALAREIADGRCAEGAEGFISSYLDLYLGRITGDSAVEADALRACLAWIGRNDREPGPASGP